MIETLNGDPIFALCSVFGMGVISSLTPCVYPLIPVTVSIFGAGEGQAKSRAAALSALYVLGMALTYTSLGMISAKSGMLFGSLLGHPAIVLGFAALLLVMSLHSLDLVTLPFRGLQSKAGAFGGKGALGALIMGLVSGAVAAPCVGPVLVLVLIEAGRSNNVAWGALLLFIYSLGMGLLFFLIGTFSGSLRRLPRAGNWLYLIKYIIAVGLLVAALYILRGVYNSNLERLAAILPSYLWVLVACIASISAFTLKLVDIKFPASIVTAICAFSLFGGYPSSDTHAEHSTQISWQSEFESALQVAARSKKPLVVDMFADWCVSCKELDRTFSHSEVAKTLSSEFIPLRIDFTQESKSSESLSEKYGVVGLPCVLFLNSDGSEIEGSRITGFVGPQELLLHLGKFLKKGNITVNS